MGPEHDDDDKPDVDLSQANDPRAVMDHDMDHGYGDAHGVDES